MKLSLLTKHLDLTSEDIGTSVSKVIKGFKVHKIDDFLGYWVILLVKHPLPENLQRVFDKQKDVSAQVGICSRHLIKTAKKQGIDQYRIDQYVEQKNNYKYLFDINIRLIKRCSERIKEDPTISNLHSTSLRVGKLESEIHTNKYLLHKYTFDLIESVL